MHPPQQDFDDGESAEAAVAMDHLDHTQSTKATAMMEARLNTEHRPGDERYRLHENHFDRNSTYSTTRAVPIEAT